MLDIAGDPVDPIGKPTVPQRRWFGRSLAVIGARAFLDDVFDFCRCEIALRDLAEFRNDGIGFQTMAVGRCDAVGLLWCRQLAAKALPGRTGRYAGGHQFFMSPGQVAPDGRDVFFERCPKIEFCDAPDRTRIARLLTYGQGMYDFAQRRKGNSKSLVERFNGRRCPKPPEGRRRSADGGGQPFADIADEVFDFKQLTGRRYAGIDQKKDMRTLIS
ncbi:hypothetical protein WM03_24725 [Burkholderia ubonensis]|nr:hypothetical protein WJ65_02850 [Burkholderia ubonensis]KWI05196.1 hypothetical protein WM02_27645 [Burkholderia ubonensis]KWI22863.1 hypothetical protein WM03_24725 [Burkholderia ubonensis]ODQ40786.1 hypothetical protein BGV63_09280 [Burkholderia ubonensis]OJA31175.1 hypothetical protein BGV58_09255 [Burkholderia ubonensis]